MTTAVLNEKRYTLSFACLLAAVFWAGVLFLSLRVIAAAAEPQAENHPIVVKNDA